MHLKNRVFALKMVCWQIPTYHILGGISPSGRENGGGREVSSPPIGVSYQSPDSTFPVLVWHRRDSEIQFFRFLLPESYRSSNKNPKSLIDECTHETRKNPHSCADEK